MCQRAGTLLSLNSSGEYWFDSARTIYTVDATSGGTITYVTTPSAWASGVNHTGASANVIPHPFQISSGGSGCGVSVGTDAFGRHTITLPVATRHIRNAGQTTAVLSDEDPLYNEQLELPEVLNGLPVDEVIPSRFLYLKNLSTGEAYLDATYYYASQTVVMIGGVDLSTEAGRPDDFVIVTVGSDLTTAVDDLRNKMGYHDHSGRYGATPIKAEDIVGWTGVAGNSGRFVKSDMDGNYAPQYLHRDGFRLAETDANDKNIMRGDLVIGSSSGAPGSYYSLTGNSFALYFGTNSGPAIYKKSIGDLHLINGQRDVHVQSSNDNVVLEAGDEIWKIGGTFAETGYVNTALHFTGGALNTGYLVGGNSGHYNSPKAAVIAEGLAVGPYTSSAVSTGNDLDLWEMQVDGVGPGDFSTYYFASPSPNPSSTGWRVPRIGILHYAQEDIGFAGYDSSGSLTATLADVRYWQAAIPLPAYLNDPADCPNASGGDVILDAMVAVKRNGNARWHKDGAIGFDAAGNVARQDIGVYWTGSDVVIRIAADDGADASAIQLFDAVSQGLSELLISVKLTLVVASHAHSGMGLTFS